MPQTPDETQVIMAFDFGMAFIGIAVGQTLTRSAQALTPIKARDGIPSWERLLNIIAEWSPDQLVVGLPPKQEGKNQHVWHAANKFANRLKEKTQRPVARIDESHTTKEAHRRQSTRAKQAGARCDSMAAQIILERYFDTIPPGKHHAD